MDFKAGVGNLTRVYQPIVDLKTNQIVHYETLLRVKDGNIQDYILQLEDNNQITLLDRWNISELSLGLNDTAFAEGKSCAINVSTKTIEDDSFIEFLAETLEKMDDPSRLIFEITETSPITNQGIVNQFIDIAKKKGCGISIDDYGSGFADETYIENIAADTLKIDGEYIKKLGTNPFYEKFVEKAVDMAVTKGMFVIAEMIETTKERDKLLEIGVHKGQGYLFGKPMPEPAPQSAIDKVMSNLNSNDNEHGFSVN